MTCGMVLPSRQGSFAYVFRWQRSIICLRARPACNYTLEGPAQGSLRPPGSKGRQRHGIEAPATAGTTGAVAPCSVEARLGLAHAGLGLDSLRPGLCRWADRHRPADL